MMLLQPMQADGPQSRADLARHSGLTPTTVSAVTADLIVDGLISEVGRKASTGAGKPSTLFGVEPMAGRRLPDRSREPPGHGRAFSGAGKRPGG